MNSQDYDRIAQNAWRRYTRRWGRRVVSRRQFMEAYEAGRFDGRSIQMKSHPCPEYPNR